MWLQQQIAQQVLTQFQEHPDAWTRVPDILERSAFPQAKVCGDFWFLSKIRVDRYLSVCSISAYRSWKRWLQRDGNLYPKGNGKVTCDHLQPNSPYIFLRRRPELRCWYHGESRIGWGNTTKGEDVHKQAQPSPRPSKCHQLIPIFIVSTSRFRSLNRNGPTIGHLSYRSS